MSVRIDPTSETSVRQPVSSVVYAEPVRARVSIEIETMTKGPPKVSVRIDHSDSEAASDEAIRIYRKLTGVLAGD